jgi:hypothetical protein
MASLGRARGRSRELGDSPGKSLLAVTLGALIIVPAIVSLVHTFQRIQLTQRLTRDGDVLNGWSAAGSRKPCGRDLRSRPSTQPS